MDLKELRERYHLPLCILHQAAVLSDNEGTSFDSNLRPAIAAYVSQLPKFPLNHTVVGVAENNGKVIVVKLLTERPAFLHAPYLLQIANNLAIEALGQNNLRRRNPDMTIAAIGERFKIDSVLTITADKDDVFGIYCHNARYACVVEIASEALPAKARKHVKTVAETIAKHVLWHYHAYDKQIGLEDFILSQPYVLGDGFVKVEITRSVWSGIKYSLSVSGYLAKSAELLMQEFHAENLKLSVKRIEVVGL